ncbi:MAG TPA: hypothetical protein H9707_09565 [Candidatus Butyricicoccus avicola]|nr:hypothetical protein [Candidatus Butyricicoccus avicola]
MAKFKSADGSVFDHILKAKHYFCYKDPSGTRFYCAECPIYIQSGEFPCEPWVNQHSAEAARLMGYEIIEDDQPEINQEAKSDGGKPRPSLVPPALIRGVDAIREFGTARYGSPDNWRKVEPQRYWDALLRHGLAAWDNWKAVDPESGMPHLWHIACNAGFLMQYMEEENGLSENKR